MNLLEEIRKVAREEVQLYLGSLLKPQVEKQANVKITVSRKMEEHCPDTTCRRNRWGVRCGAFYCVVPECGEKNGGTRSGNGCIKHFRELGKEGLKPYTQAWWAKHKTTLKGQ